MSKGLSPTERALRSLRAEVERRGFNSALALPRMLRNLARVPCPLFGMFIAETGEPDGIGILAGSRLLYLENGQVFACGLKPSEPPEPEGAMN